MNVLNKTQAISAILKGNPLAFQTDTLPAIGCKPEYSDTIYELKKRSKNKALIIMGAEIKQLLDFVHKSAKEDLISLGNEYWPGPLTLIIPTNHKKQRYLTSEDKTLGLRIPASPNARSLMLETGPLATSSANISGFENLINENEIAQNFPKLNFLGPLPWPKCSGRASTIVSWIETGQWKLIRQGEIIISNLH